MAAGRAGWLKLALVSVGAAALLLAAVWLQAVLQPLRLEMAVSTQVLDRNGEHLRLYTTADGGYWRLPADTRELDQRFLQMLFAYEDARFYSHPGVDPRALLRAAWQAVRHGRFVSGGSTLSMQTLRLLEPRPRTLWSKLLEIGRALRLEQLLSKQEILRLYLSLAPYGGNIQGVRAASLLYFGKEPRFLTVAEAALLVALPQAPERRRPDRFPERARAARNHVLKRLHDAGLLNGEEWQRARLAPLARQRRRLPVLAAHLTDRLRQADADDAIIRTTLDARLQQKLESLIARHQLQLADTLTLAVLLVHNRSAEVLAYVGSGDYAATRFPGQVDMVKARRSPGSALKPFIYGLGFDAGFIHPETLIGDRPGAVNGYAPGNFDHRYGGEMSIREALRRSRNLPAVKVLQRLGPGQFAAALRRAGLTLQLPAAVGRAGLPLALGGVGMSLEDMTRAYSALANAGQVRPLRWRQDAADGSAVSLLTASSAWYLTDILTAAPLPPGFSREGADVAFKTGTSYGFRDAWAFGYDAEHTVGVWVGRPDGGYTPGLSGLHNAVPVMLEVFGLLPTTDIAPLLKTRPPDALLANNLQLPPALRRFAADLPNGLPAPASGPVILYPPEDSLVELGEASAILTLETHGGQLPFHWLVNGRYLATTTRWRDLQWQPMLAGRAQITVIDANGRSDRVNFRIVRPSG
jgi:penicillin-binding protein 1C